MFVGRYRLPRDIANDKNTIHVFKLMLNSTDETLTIQIVLRRGMQLTKRSVIEKETVGLADSIKLYYSLLRTNIIFTKYVTNCVSILPEAIQNGVNIFKFKLTILCCFNERYRILIIKQTFYVIWTCQITPMTINVGIVITNRYIIIHSIFSKTTCYMICRYKFLKIFSGSYLLRIWIWCIVHRPPATHVECVRPVYINEILARQDKIYMKFIVWYCLYLYDKVPVLHIYCLT